MERVTSGSLVIVAYVNECDVSWLRKEEGSLVILMRAYMGCVMVLAEDAMWVRSLL